MISAIKGKKLLDGYCGQEPADVGHPHEMLVRLSNLVNTTPEIEKI